MQTTYGRFLAAGAAFGGGVVGAVFVAGNALAGLIVSWPLALGIGSLAGGLGGWVGLGATMRPGTVAELKDRAVPLVGIATVTLVLFGTVVYAWAGTDAPLVGPFAGLAAGAILAVVGYFGLLFASESLYLDRIDAESDVHIDLPYTVRGQVWARYRRPVALLGGLTAVVLVGFAVTAGASAFALYALAGLLLLRQSPAEYTITDAGLRKDRSVLPWSRFESFRFEDDTLILATGGSGRVGLRFPRDSIEDEAAVRAALSDVLEEDD